jgi:hypothetical protein
MKGVRPILLIGGTVAIGIALVVREYLIERPPPPTWSSQESNLQVRVLELENELRVFRQTIQAHYAQDRADEEQRRQNREREAAAAGKLRQSLLSGGRSAPPSQDAALTALRNEVWEMKAQLGSQIEVAFSALSKEIKGMRSDMIAKSGNPNSGYRHGSIGVVPNTTGTMDRNPNRRRQPVKPPVRDVH